MYNARVILYQCTDLSYPLPSRKTQKWPKSTFLVRGTEDHPNFETLVQNSIKQLFLFNFYCLKTRYKCLKTRSFVSKPAFHMSISKKFPLSNNRLKPVDNSLLPVDNLWITLVHRSKNSDFETNCQVRGTNC